MLVNLTFAAIGLGMAFAWLECPGAAMLVFALAFVVNLVDTLRANRQDRVIQNRSDSK